MITKLTKEQIERFPEFVQKWTNIGLSTEPANRIESEKAIKFMYAQANLKEPLIVWCTSPIANGLTRASAWASAWASVWDSVGASVGASVRDSVRDSVWDSVRDSVKDSVRASAWDSAWASVWDSVGASVGASVRDSVGASVGASVGDSVWASVRDSVWASGYGQHDASWLGFYDYFYCVCGLTQQTEKLKGLWLQAENGGWYLPYEKICWVSERHNILRLNKDGRLHCENDIALAYPDGWGIYAINGIRMKPEYVLTPAEKIDIQTVMAEENVDQRRELIRKIGVDRMISAGKILEETEMYKLIDMSPVFLGLDYAPHLFMVNPSLEDTFHLEGVGRECKSIQQALNWRAGNIEVLWTPEQLS